MSFGFLFWLFLGGIIVASLQDLKRREVDNWLNLFLLVSGLVFIFYKAILFGDLDIIFHVGFLLVVMFVIMNLFYYGRVFAGGDAKLLVAMTAFFVGLTFWSSMINIGVFLFFLMLSGSVYGMGYSLFLYFKNKKKVDREMASQIANRKSQIAGTVLFGLVLMSLGFVDFIFLLTGVLLIVLFGLYVFTKGLENVLMVRAVSGEELREGDWLVEDVVVGGRRVIKADWDGLSLEDIKLLKNKKRVLIKEGLPFVPAFLIAFLLYVFFNEWFVGLFLF